MAVRLTRLRIAGFKSFAEPAALDILPGLTGIVGPNGCGKSNVVEALRWAMGETSARSLRGGEMDDVIFAGTVARASRNLAEVTITLEAEPEAPLPTPFEQEAELQVTRRIERGAGSGFRANGRELRARDVQTLYADLASGARSSGMVSQGRVAALVGAKPEERRQVLEEAAGITGLHARRHEAELKLRAAEQNLSRAEDLRTQLDANREGLRRQARQANRYRALSGHVAAAEAGHIAILHAREQAHFQAAEASYEAASTQAAKAGADAEQAAALARAAEAALPAPAAEEAASRSLLERRRVEAETLAGEAERAAKACQEAESRAADATTDLAEAESASREAASRRAAFAEESAALAARRSAIPAEIQTATDRLAAASAALAEAEAAADAATTAASEAAAEQRQAVSASALAAARAEAAATRHAGTQTHHDSLAQTLPAAGAVEEAAEAEARAEAQVAECRVAVQQAESARALAEAARDQAQRARATRESQAAEAEAAITPARAKTLLLSNEAASLEAAWQAQSAACVPKARIAASEHEAALAAEACAVAEARLDQAERQASESAAEAALLARKAGDLEAVRDRAQAALEAATRDLAARDKALATLAAERDEAEAGQVPAAALARAAKAHADAQDGFSRARDAYARLAEGRLLAEASLAECRSLAATGAADAARSEAAAEGLRAMLGHDEAEFPAAIDALSVPPGLEDAAGAALADTGQASLDPAATTYWRALPCRDAAVPARDTAPLAPLVNAPEALARALSHVLLLDPGSDGEAVQERLAPGQIAVDRAGNAWRWDGLVRRAAAPNQAAARLQARARLASAEAVHHRAREDMTRSAGALAEAERSCEAACAFETDARAAQDRAEAALREAREAREALESQASRAASRLAGVLPALAREQAGRAEALLHHDEAEAGLAAIPDSAGATDASAKPRDAAARAAEDLTASRLARQMSRDALAKANDTLRRLTADAAEAERRLASLAPRLERARMDAEGARDTLHQAEAAASLLHRRLGEDIAHLALAEQAQGARRAQDETSAALASALSASEAARRHATNLATHRIQTESRLAAAATLLAGQATECGEAAAALAAAQTRELDCADATGLAANAEHARRALAQARTASSEAQMARAALEAEESRLVTALAHADAERAAWQARAEEASRRSALLARREEAARQDIARLRAAREALDARAGDQTASLDAAAAAHTACASTLRELEDAQRQAATAERDAHAASAWAREAVATAGGARDAAAAGLRAVLARAEDRLGADHALPVAEDHSPAAEDHARRKLDRLIHERDEMGPVNLRAESEVETLDQRLATLDRERDELTTAIARLRGAIGHLNREGRERLAAVFQAVDGHFRTLFTRMMGGGRAHLAWSGSDDPLLAGLEIYAEPPGKKLSALSLLSGGEQALTALSLIFAVFRCTPAPLCVLDEVDAPLDDANVERFCTLLDDVVRETGTRFLVVTHHQLTMSRMDRLFGVTMQERGVSRVLSVDLAAAGAFAAPPALQAAE